MAMEDKRVIRFPTERRLQAAARSQAEAGPQAVRAEQPLPAAGESFAFLSLEVRRLPRSDSRIGGDVAGRILNRCILSCLEVLSKERIPVDLAGSVLRPVIEATFTGEDAEFRAVRAASAARDSLRKVQRDVENEFHLFGAITDGMTTELETGVKVTSGWPQQIAGRFREHAGPGQLLLSEEVHRAVEGRVEVAEALEVTVPGDDPVPGYPLIALRS
jgi:hypothetical protein